MLSSIFLQLFILVKAFKKKKAMKEYSDEEQPTYCVLAVMVVDCVQLNLIMGLFVQFLRLFYTLIGNNFVSFVLDKHYWLYFIYQVFFPITSYTMEFVFISQTFEWAAMYNVIIAQKGKLNEEIYFDTVNSHLKEKRTYKNIPPQRNNTRTSELCYLWVFIISFAVKAIYTIGIIIVQLSCTDLVDLPPIYGYLSMWISVFEIILMVIVFAYLMCLMHRYQNYEFNRLWKNLTIYFFLIFLAYSLSTFIFT